MIPGRGNAGYHERVQHKTMKPDKRTPRYGARVHLDTRQGYTMISGKGTPGYIVTRQGYTMIPGKGTP
mgnify:CR=1 FL=1